MQSLLDTFAGVTEDKLYSVVRQKVMDEQLGGHREGEGPTQIGMMSECEMKQVVYWTICTVPRNAYVLPS